MFETKRNAAKTCFAFRSLDETGNGQNYRACKCCCSTHGETQWKRLHVHSHRIECKCGGKVVGAMSLLEAEPFHYDFLNRLVDQSGRPLHFYDFFCTGHMQAWEFSFQRNQLCVCVCVWRQKRLVSARFSGCTLIGNQLIRIVLSILAGGERRSRKKLS